MNTRMTLSPGLLVALVAAAGLALLAMTKGGIRGAAAALGAGAVTAATGAVSGAVGAVGAAVGLPDPGETTTDPAVARWLIDEFGHGEASAWASAWALIRGELMAAGTGTPPPPGSAVARAHPRAIDYGTGQEWDGPSPQATLYQNGSADPNLPGDALPQYGFPM